MYSRFLQLFGSKASLLRNSSGRLPLPRGPVVLFAFPLLLLIASSANGVISSEGLLRNVSTRLTVLTGENVLIAGFKVAQSQQVLVRGLGPTLTNFGVTGALADPTIALYNSSGAIIASNDNWKDTNLVAIAATGKAPPNDKESAILASLPSGSYTAIVQGKNNTTGVGLVEAYGIVPSPFVNLISNISSRGLVGTGNNVMIGGFIVDGGPSLQVIVRALGPTLTQFGISNALANPTLELRDGNGNLLAFNDDWQQGTSQALIQMLGLAPPNSNESAIFAVIDFGASVTAIVRGKNNTTGVALFEVYAP
jgi:hypothetical protein